MTEWRTDERTRKEFPPYQMVAERTGDQTSHLVTFPDKRKLRVLSDGLSSGQKRSRVVVSALTIMSDLTPNSGALPPGYDPMSYLIGCLSRENLRWRVELEVVPAVEIITDFLKVEYDAFVTMPEAGAVHLIADLDAAGWVIVRREEV